MAHVAQRGHWATGGSQSAKRPQRQSFSSAHEEGAVTFVADEMGDAAGDVMDQAKEAKHNLKEIKQEWRELRKQRHDGQISKQENSARLKQMAKDVIEEPAFNFIVACAILVCVIAMTIQVDSPHLLPAFVWDLINQILVIFFTVELAVRMFAYGIGGFFCAEDWGWNCFDFIVVFISWAMMIFSFFEEGISHDKGGRIVKLLRTVRMLRILRVLRIFKLKALQKLNTIVNGLISSFSVVAWIAVLQVIVMFCSAIVCTNFIGLQSDDWDGDDKEEILHFFGSMSASAKTLFQFLTLADWSAVTRLVAKRNMWMAGFFIVYICFAAMVILSLLTGVLADHVNTVREEQEAEEEQETAEHFSEALKAEYRAFRAGDTKNQHAVNKETFQEMLTKKAFRDSLKTCGVDVDDLDPGELFDSFDSMGGGLLTWHDFRAGMEEMRVGVVPKEVFKLEASLQRAIASCEGKHAVHYSGVNDQAEKEEALTTAGQTAFTIQNQLDSLIATMEDYIDRAEGFGREDSDNEDSAESSD